VVLERHEFDAFLTLSEELHFGRTAERLRVSTARVSQTIRKLERQVGSPLFIRTSRRVELTAVGRQLYDDLRPARNMIDTAMQRAIDAGRGFTGTLRAGFLTAAVLAVPSGHPIARAESVSLEDLTRLKLLQPPGTLPESWRIANAPASTPAGRPIGPDRRPPRYKSY
jgi:DNA-binding transcriptional LysR family regulator